MLVKYKRLFRLFFYAIILLLIPLIAMQFTKEVRWTILDFCIASIILFTTALLIEIVLRTITNLKLRIVLLTIIISALLLIWAELSVGIFDSPFAGS